MAFPVLVVLLSSLFTPTLSWSTKRRWNKSASLEILADPLICNFSGKVTGIEDWNVVQNNGRKMI